MDVMIDLETWGTRAGCDIRSIGGIQFDPQTGNIGNWKDGWPGAHSEFYQATDNPVRLDARLQFSDPNQFDADRTYPLFRDPQTVQWWSEQSSEAQAAFADPMDLRQALIAFGGWLRGLSGDIYDPADHKRRFPDDRRLWCHGPSFDVPIIDAAYVACGLPVPWHYRAPRDTRTAFDLAGITDHSAWLSARPGPLGIVHHSLDDSICQARAICDAYARISVASSNDSA